LDKSQVEEIKHEI